VSVSKALHGPHPAARVHSWQTRRLAPDVVRIELAGLVPHDAARVVRSMAQALVDVHGTEPEALAAARADNGRRSTSWLEDGVAVMVADTRTCHTQWNQQH
jgi:hypothetical protein